MLTGGKINPHQAGADAQQFDGTAIQLGTPEGIVTLGNDR